MNPKDLDLIAELYRRMPERIAQARRLLGRPLTLAEKIIYSHLASPPNTALVRGKSHLNLLPDRVAMQDATAQMALLQFIVTERDTVAVPTTIHCDHLILAQLGAERDLPRAKEENREVYEFLSSAAGKYGIGFWGPGSGIIHQVVLEQYAFPGGLMIGTDSHTPNAGGMGMCAVGVGGADAVDVMAGQPWGVMNPKLIGVRLTGRLSGWTSAKDIILKVAGILTVKGGTGRIVEYFGPGTESVSCTGKATVTNMGAELGATTSIFPFDERIGRYLEKTDRADLAELARRNAENLRPDAEVLEHPEKFFDQVLEINLSELEPGWVGPHTPDLWHGVKDMKQAVAENHYPDVPTRALIGSCTNSSYEDISRASAIVKQAKNNGLRAKVPLLVTPGSEQVFRTMERDGFLKLFLDVGATVLANACGPCIGQWKRDDIKAGQKNSIVTTYNRNFAKRNDGNPETLAFIGSPEMVTAMAFGGSLGFDPRRDKLSRSDGSEFKFEEPEGDELPPSGFVMSRAGFVAPEQDVGKRKAMSVNISPNSERLSFLESFAPWNGTDMVGLLVLAKAKGKCTTDHISQAGPWLKYRGHLARISDNMLLGATNAFSGETGKGKDVLSGESSLPFPEVAKRYKAAGKGWVIIGDENYGEGSSREHAAMSPRFLGCRAVIVKSFARIHETNLKKQGVLPLTFADPRFYEEIRENDRVAILGLTQLVPGRRLTLKVVSPDGDERETEVAHTLTEEEIGWFKAGSALNILKPK